MTNYLHGLHCGALSDGYDSTGAALMASRPGLLVFTEIASEQGGGDYRPYTDLGYTVLVRLNHSYPAPEGQPQPGTIPVDPADYDAFAVRVAQHIAGARGDVAGWIIGNEPNVVAEGAIAADKYADCFKKIRALIDVPLYVAGVGPWNATRGDWVDYLAEVLEACAGLYDGVALHSYTHGPDVARITADAPMDPPYQDRHFEFRCYRDFMEVIPQGIPVYITETDQNDPWLTTDNGWVDMAYAEIDGWNRANPAHVIRGMALYRYPDVDKWVIKGNAAIENAFRAVVDVGYSWDIQQPEPPEEEPMAWRTAYQSSFEEGFYDYQSISELTCPIGWQPGWKEASGEQRPEYDSKRAEDGHPEIHTGARAANFFAMSSKMRACLFKVFTLTPGQRYRVSAWCMGVATAEGAGLRIVTDPAGGYEWEREDTAHSEWWGNYGDVEGYNRKWVQLAAEGEVGATGKLSVFLVGHNDYAIEGGHCHWDDVLLQVEDETIPPPPPPPVTGEHRVNVLIDGVDIGELPFDVQADVSAVLANVRFARK